MSLWLVVQKRYGRTSILIEPVTVGSEHARGPAIFLSRIVANVYATLRNRYDVKDDSGYWQVMPLEEFDLLKHIRDCNGALWCMMTHGVAVDGTSSIIVAEGVPRIRYVPLRFRPPTDTDEMTFLFNESVFDFIRTELNSIGLSNYEEQLEALDELDDEAFADTMMDAIEQVKVRLT